MDRIRYLNKYQKFLLIFMLIMILAFTVIYAVTISRVGYRYLGAVLVPEESGGVTTYTGKALSLPAQFTVSGGNTVTFTIGSASYGPYTVTEDPTAIPQILSTGVDPNSLKGIEVRRGEEILFRGGVLDTRSGRHMYDSDGSLLGVNITYSSGGAVYTANGDLVDLNEPSVSTILDLISGPELTHKGEWGFLLLGIFFCIVTALSIIFADELFEFYMAFRVSSASIVEPSDWEIAGRYIGWTALQAVIIGVFIVGLR